ncbi:MAG: response regulator transcription factor [Anaerolineales bacterium]
MAGGAYEDPVDSAAGGGDLAKELNPEVVVLDIVMPDMDGLQALAALRATLPATGVIMTTAYSRPDFMARAIALGVGGYITKDDEPSSTPKAIREVAEGDAIVNREILQIALRDIADTARSGPKPEASTRRPSRLSSCGSYPHRRGNGQRCHCHRSFRQSQHREDSRQGNLSQTGGLGSYVGRNPRPATRTCRLTRSIERRITLG